MFQYSTETDNHSHPEVQVTTKIKLQSCTATSYHVSQKCS